MKNLLFTLSLIFISITITAQTCIPNSNFADSSYGIWPDTITNLPLAVVDVPYSTVLNFKIPDEVTEDVTGGDPNLVAFIGSEIQSYTVISVDGLPPGYEFSCNGDGCAYLGGEIGCGNIFGTTFNAGVYPVTITVEAVILVVLFPGLPPTPVTQVVTFSGYQIVVNIEDPCTDIQEGIDVIESCGSYTWMDGITYTANNNTATYLLTTAQGCDSLVTLNLTIDNGCPECFPDASFADSTYGIWPDTITNLPLAEVDVPYSTVLNFKIPDEVTQDLDPSGSFVGFEIESYTVTSVDGLPLGYEFSCNAEGCAYLGGEIGCGNIFGTTGEAGIYPVTIQVSADLYLPIIGIYSTNLTFSGYQIVVNESNAVIENINPLVCESYTSPSGNIYTESGTYVDTIFQANTIDSIYNIDLTILPTYETSISAFSCDTFTLNGQNYSSAGVYTQSYTNTFGCDSIITLELTIPDAIEISFTSNEQLFTAPPFAVAFSNTSDDLANYTYTWYWGDGNSTTSNNGTVFHEYLYNGLYTVTLEAINNETGCIYEITYTDYIYTTGGVVHQIELDQEAVSIYPNPTRGNVTISASSTLTNGYVMYDQQGRVVLTGALKGKHTSISLERLSRGSYTIKVEGNYKPMMLIKD